MSDRNNWLQWPWPLESTPILVWHSHHFIYHLPRWYICKRAYIHIIFFTTFKVRKSLPIPILKTFITKMILESKYLNNSFSRVKPPPHKKGFTPNPLPLYLPRISPSDWKQEVYRLDPFHLFTEIISLWLKWQSMSSDDRSLNSSTCSSTFEWF